MKSEEKKLFKKMDSSKKTTVKLLRIIGLRGGEGGGGGRGCTQKNISNED